MVSLTVAAEDADEARPGKARAVRRLVPRAISAMRRRSAFALRSLAETPLVSHWSDQRYDAKRARHAIRLPSVSDEQRTVLADLDDAGVAVRAVDLPPDVVASADRFVGLLRRKTVDKPCVKATPRELAGDPTLFLWGLSGHLLDLAECHIGLPARYLGVEVKRELVESAAGGNHEAVRRWHLDHEDRRILKVVIYLADVGAGAGPFGYVHRSHTAAILESTRGHNLRGVPDDRMQGLVPRTEWTQVTGPRMTAIHVDTGQVFHRVFPPSTSERYSVTFAYSSRSPYYVYSRLMLPRRAIQQLRHSVSQRQWDALCVGRRGPGAG